MKIKLLFISFSLCFSTSFLHAKDSYQRVFTDPAPDDADRAEAFIGRRASIQVGEKSSIRWLSRLIKQKPQAEHFVIEWFVIRNGKEISLVTYYKKTSQIVGCDAARHLAIEDQVWGGITTKEIHQVARRRGTIQSFRKYGLAPEDD